MRQYLDPTELAQIIQLLQDGTSICATVWSQLHGKSWNNHLVTLWGHISTTMNIKEGLLRSCLASCIHLVDAGSKETGVGGEGHIGPQKAERWS